MRAPRRLLGLFPGTPGFMSSGHGGVFPGPRPLPSLPFSAGGLLLSTPSCRVQLRYLIILPLLLPAPAEPFCLSHRFPVSHVAERERRIGSRSATICGERAESRARGGQGRAVGRRFQVCERAECDRVRSAGAASRAASVPPVRKAAASAAFIGFVGGGAGAAPGQPHGGFPRAHTHRLTRAHPLPAGC